MTLQNPQLAVLDTLPEEESEYSGEFKRLPRAEFYNMLTLTQVKVLSIEGQVLERQGLIHGYYDPFPDVYFDIPDWQRLLKALRAFGSACGPY